MEDLVLVEFNNQFTPFKVCSFFEKNIEDTEMLRRLYDEITGLIVDTQKHVRNNFIALGYALWRFKRSELYPNLFNHNALSNYFIGNTNCFYDVCYDYFHLRKSSVKSYIEVYERFCVGDKIKPEFENYSYSALVEMCALPSECFSDLRPSMTISEIRRYKQSRLSVDCSVPSLPCVSGQSSGQTSGQNCQDKQVDKLSQTSGAVESSPSVREDLTIKDQKTMDVKLLKSIFVQYVKDFASSFDFELSLCGHKQSPRVFAGTLFDSLNEKGFFKDLL